MNSIRVFLIKLLFVVFTIAYPVQAKSVCPKGTMTYQKGESLHYLAYYNWGFIWVNAGWVEFNVKDTLLNSKHVYHLDAFGSSHSNYDWFYKVRDRYQSFLDEETLLPSMFIRENQEGDYWVNHKYLFDHKNNTAYSFTENKDRPYSEDTLKLPNCTQDLLSMVYFARNINFTGVKIGDKIPVTTIIDKEVFNLYIRFLGPEEVKTKEGDKYKCLKFSALLVEGTIFKGGEELFVWITDDKNRVPILVEAKILIGSVKAYFVGAKGLRYPVSSKIN